MLQKLQPVDYIAGLHEKFPLLPKFENNAVEATAHYYATCLKTNAKAVTFVERTLGICLADAESLSIGFSDRSLGNHLPSKDVLHGKKIRTKLEQLEILKENGRESLRAYVTIPLYDDQDNITGIHAVHLDAKSIHDEPIIIGSGTRKLALNEQAIAYQTLMAKSVEQLSSTVLEHQNPQPSNQPTTEPQPAALQPQCVSTRLSRPEQTTTSESTTAQADAPTTIVAPDSITIIRGDRQYKVTGLDRNMSSLALKVAIAASRRGLVHLDTIDLMRAAARQSFIRAAATELYIDEEIVRKDIGSLLLQLEDLRNQQVQAAKAAKQPQVVLTEAESREALALLKDPNLTHRIVDDLEQCGMVGEAFNKLAAYLAVTSRKLSQPLAILIQSSSSAGKTTLMDSILSMIPPEDFLRLSNLTAQSLYYLDSSVIRQKTLAISEDHGLAEAAYALKLLQSEGKLTHATVAKGANGQTTTQLHTVEGPVQLLLTSTSKEIDEELANRCLMLTVDESREQTKAIQDRQRLLQTTSGQAAKHVTDDLQTLHRNAQRLLRPMKVYNNHALKLSFPSERTRNRRDNAKYLTLIQAIALLHQQQRTISTDVNGIESIEVQQLDIDLADRLMKKILAQSLDELPPQTKRCFELLKQFAAKQCQQQSVTQCDLRFTRRAFREAIEWTDHQIRIHLDKLVSLEYVIVHRGKQGSTYVYELV